MRRKPLGRSCSRSSRPSGGRARCSRRQAFANAIRSVAATGGSTNAVLHLLAIAHEAGIPLALDDFDRLSRDVPVLADLKPSGKYTAVDLHAAGGSRVLAQRLLEGRWIDGASMTVTGKSAG